MVMLNTAKSLTLFQTNLTDIMNLKTAFNYLKLYSLHRSRLDYSHLRKQTNNAYIYFSLLSHVHSVRLMINLTFEAFSYNRCWDIMK